MNWLLTSPTWLPEVKVMLTEPVSHEWPSVRTGGTLDTVIKGAISHLLVGDSSGVGHGLLHGGQPGQQQQWRFLAKVFGGEDLMHLCGFPVKRGYCWG